TAVLRQNVVDTDTGKEIAYLEDKYVSDHWSAPPFVISRSGSLIAGACLQSTSTPGLSIWESATGKAIARSKIRSWGGLLAFHPGERLVAISDFGGVHLWDVAAGKIIATRKSPTDIIPSSFETHSSCLAFTPDGRHLAT